MVKIVLFVLSLLVISGCSSLKVNVDYDPSFKLSEFKTYAIVHSDLSGEDTLLSDRLISALERELNLKSYTKASQEEADFILTFHTNAESKTDIDTDYRRMGYGRYGYGGHMVATTRTYTYTKGTLIVDVLNPKDNKIVWRGVTTDVLKTYDTPTEKTAYINEVVKETMKDLPLQGSNH